VWEGGVVCFVLGGGVEDVSEKAGVRVEEKERKKPIVCGKDPISESPSKICHY
jgi:hypothetical protein